MKSWWRSKRPYVLSSPIYWLVRLFGITMKITVEGFEKSEALPVGKIYAGWHGRSFLGALHFRGKGMWTIISHSRDGEMQNRIFTKFGFKTIRGSSGRGGVRALIECIRVLKTGASLAFTPDGPRGPTHIVQEGILSMAQKSGAVIVPCGASANRRWLAGSWDSYMIPKPFSRAIVLYGDPIPVPAQTTKEEFEQIRLQVEEALNNLEREAESRMGHPSG